MEINSNYCLEYLKREKILINYDEFKHQIQSNPNYPSLLAISETLELFGIHHSVGRLESCHISHLPNSFSALIEKEDSVPFNVYVERTNIGFRYLENQRWIEVNSNQFGKLFRNIILVIEGGEKNRKNWIERKNILLQSFIGLNYFGLLLIADSSAVNLLIALLAIAGLFFSSEVIQKELGFDTRFSRKICSIAVNTDCGAIRKKRERKYLDFLSMSEFSAIFFSVQLFTLFTSALSKNLNGFYALMLALLILCIPISIYSLYLQRFKAKKWCPICLGIIIVLFAELFSLILFHSFEFKIVWSLILQMSLGLILTALLLNKVKTLIQNNSKQRSDLVELQRFQRNYKLFKLTLFSDDLRDAESQIGHGLTVGNPAAKLKFIVVTSPFCSACAKFHFTIEKLVERYPDELSFDIRFLLDSETSDQLTKNVYRSLVAIYLLKGANKFRESLTTWFESNDYALLSTQLDSITTESCNINNKIETMLHEQFLWGRAHQITFTPSVFINGYQFPVEYDLKDINYFIKDLIEDLK